MPSQFADGLDYRVEIPSVEGPAVLRAVVEEADARGVAVRRVSQGSGVMLTDGVSEMASPVAERGIEVSLFLGPRGALETGGQSIVTAATGGVARGADGVEWCEAEARLAAGTGSARGSSPTSTSSCTSGGCARPASCRPSLIFKISCGSRARTRRRRAFSNGSARARSTSQPTSPAAQLGEIRAVCSLPLDLYIEVPDDQGGFVRFYEAPEVIRTAAPVYLKLGIRNAPNAYPVGLHLADTAAKLARERVRRAELLLRLLEERAPELRGGFGDEQPADLAVPEPA